MFPSLHAPVFPSTCTRCADLRWKSTTRVINSNAPLGCDGETEEDGTGTHPPTEAASSTRNLRASNRRPTRASNVSTTRVYADVLRPTHTALLHLVHVNAISDVRRAPTGASLDPSNFISDVQANRLPSGELDHHSSGKQHPSQYRRGRNATVTKLNPG